MVDLCSCDWNIFDVLQNTAVWSSDRRYMMGQVVHPRQQSLSLYILVGQQWKHTKHTHNIYVRLQNCFNIHMHPHWHHPQLLYSSGITLPCISGITLKTSEELAASQAEAIANYDFMVWRYCCRYFSRSLMQIAKCRYILLQLCIEHWYAVKAQIPTAERLKSSIAVKKNPWWLVKRILNDDISKVAYKVWSPNVSWLYHTFW